jgi:ADP-ribose pyrophosphatase YjhB (NUDIX family)
VTTRVLRCTGVLERDGAVLLVASRYPNQRQPLWNLPGGRPREGELLGDALVREWREETGLEIRIDRLLYVSESLDPRGGVAYLNATFAVQADGVPKLPEADAHVVDLAWVPRAALAQRLVVAVVREPLLRWLAGDERRYQAFDDAQITIEFADEP